jgi:amino acid permease
MEDALLRSTTLPQPLLSAVERVGDELQHENDTKAHATASFAGSVFNLSAATLGAGALSLPYAVSLIGSRLALVLLVVAVLGAFLSIELLVGALDSAQCATYETITTKRLGARMAACVEAAILAFCIGTCVAYMIALGDIIEVLLVRPAVMPLWAPHTREQLMVCAWALLLMPISLPRSLAALQSATFGGTLALCVLVGTVCWHTARALEEGRPEPSAPSPAAAPLQPLERVCGSVSIIMFAFTCQVNVPEVYHELRARSPARMRRVAASALTIALVLYVLIGLGAYAEFGAATRADVLKNYDVWSADGRDRPMLPSYALMGLTIVVAYPFNVFPARQTLEGALAAALGTTAGAHAEARRAPSGTATHVGLTVLITGGALLVALFVPGINVVFQLLGGTASALVCFCVPGMLALRSRLPLLASAGGRASAYALVGGGALVGLISTAVTIAGLFR